MSEREIPAAKIEAFKRPYAVNSALKEQGLGDSEIQSYFDSLDIRAKHSNSPNKKDDGISGERSALVIRSVDIGGLHNIRDPGIIDVGGALMCSVSEEVDKKVILHYAIPAGGGNIIIRNDKDEAELCRIYETISFLSNSEEFDRTGEVVLVEMLGPSHGKIRNSANGDGGGGASAHGGGSLSGADGGGDLSGTGPAINFNYKDGFKWIKEGSRRQVGGKRRKIQYPAGLSEACVPEGWPKDMNFYIWKKLPKSGVKRFILHETGGWSVDRMERSALVKGSGVHFACGGLNKEYPDGAGMTKQAWTTVYQYHNYDERVYHAPGANLNGIGVEFCRPFYGGRLSKTSKNYWGELMYDAGNFYGAGKFPDEEDWSFGKNRTYPEAPKIQMEVAYALCMKVCNDLPQITKQTLAYDQNTKIFNLQNGCVGGSKSQPAKITAPGITSHNAIGHHGDGSLMEIYVTLRLLGLSMNQAYNAAQQVWLDYKTANTRSSSTILPSRLQSPPAFKFANGDERSKWRSGGFGRRGKEFDLSFYYKAVKPGCTGEFLPNAPAAEVTIKIERKKAAGFMTHVDDKYCKKINKNRKKFFDKLKNKNPDLFYGNEGSDGSEEPEVIRNADGTCPDGYELNPQTGNCKKKQPEKNQSAPPTKKKKVPVDPATGVCPPGYTRTGTNECTEN